MQAKITEEIKTTAFYGVIFPDETKRFDDSCYFNKETLFKYRISQIKFFIGEKQEKGTTKK